MCAIYSNHIKLNEGHESLWVESSSVNEVNGNVIHFFQHDDLSVYNSVHRWLNLNLCMKYLKSVLLLFEDLFNKKITT